MAALTAVATAASLSQFATIAGIASTAIGAVGAISGAQAQAASASYNARLSDRDAYIADQNRKLAIETARIDAEDKRRDNRRVQASIRASYGASGVSFAGSPLDVLEDSAIENELDAQRIEFEGRSRARDAALQGQGASESAALSRNTASSARSGGALAALGIVASGAGQTLQRMG